MGARETEEAFRYYRRLERVQRYVREHLAEELSLQVVADVAGLEKSYFSAFFRRRVGVGFKRWIDAVRVERASELLRASNYSISEIADLVGFGSIRGLERAFRRHLGTTPSEYKRGARPGLDKRREIDN